LADHTADHASMQQAYDEEYSHITLALTCATRDSIAAFR